MYIKVPIPPLWEEQKLNKVSNDLRLTVPSSLISLLKSGIFPLAKILFDYLVMPDQMLTPESSSPFETSLMDEIQEESPQTPDPLDDLLIDWNLLVGSIF